MKESLLKEKVRTHIDLMEGTLEKLVVMEINSVGDMPIIAQISELSEYILSLSNKLVEISGPR